MATNNLSEEPIRAETRRKAEAGDLEEQYSLALMLYRAEHGPRDDEEALRWSVRAAESGHGAAQNLAGILYCSGLGSNNLAEGIKWLQRAAQQGLQVAASNLGWEYEEGRIVAHDEEEALSYYRMAADENCHPAMLHYARLRFSRSEIDEGLVYLRRATSGASAADRAVLEATVARNRCVSCLTPGRPHLCGWFKCFDCQAFVCMACIRPCHSCLSHQLIYDGIKSRVCECRHCLVSAVDPEDASAFLPHYVLAPPPIPVELFDFSSHSSSSSSSSSSSDDDDDDDDDDDENVNAADRHRFLANLQQNEDSSDDDSNQAIRNHANLDF